jgi:hypothetical protein
MDLNWILANYDKLTPEEKWLAQKEFGRGSGGFYFNVQDEAVTPGKGQSRLPLYPNHTGIPHQRLTSNLP